MLNIIFDATLITNVFKKDAARSGIFFVAQNLLDELLSRNDLNVSLYFSPEYYANGVRVFRELYPNANYAQNMSSYKLLCDVNLKFWQIHGMLYHRTLLRKPFALGIVLTQRLLSFLAKRKIDRFKFQTADVFLSPAYRIPDVVREFSNIRSFLVLHDTIPFKFPTYNDIGWSHYLREIMRTGRKGDSFFCDSKCTQRDFIELYPLVTEGSSKVVPLAANGRFIENKNLNLLREVKAKYGIPVDKRYVFSLCTLEPRKNLIRSVKTFVDFCKKNKIDDLVWILGGGHWDNFIGKLKTEIDCLDECRNLVIRAGYIDDVDLPILYSNAEWFVYTSQYEGFGLPPLEAMQCGCPVITSNNSSLPEVVGDAGILIDWDSDEQHVAAYEKYYFNENLRKENSRKGLERAKLFSWKKTVDQMVRVMKENMRT